MPREREVRAALEAHRTHLKIPAEVTRTDQRAHLRDTREALFDLDTYKEKALAEARGTGIADPDHKGTQATIKKAIAERLAKAPKPLTDAVLAFADAVFARVDRLVSDPRAEAIEAEARNRVFLPDFDALHLVVESER